MTFYNVLSALLFVGVLRVLLLGFEASNWADVYAAGSLIILVFNDMLSTSHYVENKKEVDYTLPLMVIDLCNFLLLAGAMIIISPNNNLFDVSLPRVAAFLGPGAFWVFLILYWLLLMLWTHIAERKSTASRLLWQATVPAMFGIGWLLHVCCNSALAETGRVIVLIYLSGYMVLRRVIGKQRTQQG